MIVTGTETTYHSNKGRSSNQLKMAENTKLNLRGKTVNLQQWGQVHEVEKREPHPAVFMKKVDNLYTGSELDYFTLYSRLTEMD